MADSIERAVIREYWQQSRICMPTYTPLGWWENDIYRVTKSGTWIEYEVKRSRSDFAADAKKTKSWRGVRQTKHELLEGDPSRGPSMFYFVVPEDLKLDCPPWAGLVIAKLHRNDSWTVAVQKQAPKRHSRQVDKEVISGIYRTSYFRLMHKWHFGITETVEEGAGI